MTALPSYEPYQFIRLIGTGSMGRVYLAERKDTGEQVAVKVVAYRGPGPDNEQVEIEERGAAIQKAIDELHVARVNRWMRVEGDLLIEMEYVAGGDLAKGIQSGPFPPRRAATIVIELCEMLAALSRSTPPVIHGDLKLRNVLLCRPAESGDTAIKVIDFGIAKQMRHDDGTCNPWQTVQYSSPERLTTNVMSLQSDLWSVSVMLYELAVGNKPFKAPPEGMRDRILNGHGPDPMPMWLPPPLARIILKGLAVRPQDRYQRPEEMATDLQRFLKGEPVLGRNDETSRTAQTGVPLDETARTASVDGETVRSSPPRPTKGWPRKPVVARVVMKPLRMRSPLTKLAASLAGVGFAIGFISWQAHVAKAASTARQALDADRMNVANAWSEYSELRGSSHLPFLLHGFENSLERKLIDAGSVPILNYRSDGPQPTEPIWNQAAEDFRHALELDSRNTVAQADLLICEGHVSRIRARQRRGNQWVYSSALLRQAIQDFQKAATLMPQSADPYLGLERIYYYDEKDYARGEDMLTEAERRGHPISRREKLQQADALRERAIRSLHEADEFSDMPERQRQYLESARDDFRSAVSLYDQLLDYDPGLTRWIRDTLKRLHSAEARLQQANPAPTSFVGNYNTSSP